MSTDIAKRAIEHHRRLFLRRKEQGKCQGDVRETARLNCTVGSVASVMNQSRREAV
jgi:hypothetical protein